MNDTLETGKAALEQPLAPNSGQSPDSVVAGGPQFAAPGCRSLRSVRDEAEISAIRRALEQTGWNRTRAAQLLSISYRGLLYKIRQYKIMPASELDLSTFSQRMKTE